MYIQDFKLECDKERFQDPLIMERKSYYRVVQNLEKANMENLKLKAELSMLKNEHKGSINTLKKLVDKYIEKKEENFKLKCMLQK
ncbi:hypothetical protein [Anaerofustis sp.]|uniref:hypothetical protein n=1 Tax=Anaerofustis sp. TaxID=1872517 RepID=UPI0025C2210D|nr:hypothetical protein [Anaerofustis sp.]